MVLYVYVWLVYLTRFNKICHPSQRPRWQVDKEAIGLSSVQYGIVRICMVSVLYVYVWLVCCTYMYG